LEVFNFSEVATMAAKLLYSSSHPLLAIYGFWNSPEHVPVTEFRRGAATLDVLAVPGSA